ncbi:MAG: sialidase family protein, partial [Abditibacteriaceae bacterium]
ISTDGCRSWSAPKVLAPIGHEETPEASYPALCELPNGTIVTVFGQVNRADSNEPFSIRYVRFNPTC